MKIFGLVIMSEKKLNGILTEKKSWHDWYVEKEKENKKLKNELANIKLTNNLKDIDNPGLDC